MLYVGAVVVMIAW